MGFLRACLKLCKLDEGLKHFLILCVITTVVLPMICTSLRDSIFYIKPINVDKEKKLLKIIDSKRLNESLRILNLSNSKNIYDGRPRHSLFKNQNIDIGVTIITVSRNRHQFDLYEPKYLTQVAGKIVSLLKDPALNKTYAVFLCNVDPDPNSYTEISPLSRILPTFQRFNAKIPQHVHILEKEKQDYLFCLNETMNRKANYTFLIEDDAYPDDRLFSVLEHVIDNRIENKFSECKSKVRDVTYVKFYHPTRLLGYYSLEVERILELISISVLFGTIMCQSYAYLYIKSKYSMNKMWFLFTVYSCLVAIAIGRQNIMEFRRVSSSLFQVTPAPSCCTPALLFTQHGGQKVMEYMQNVRCRYNYAKDMVLEDVKRKHGLVGLLVQPNLFKHIGLYSSLRSKVLDPFIV
ncbi:post-GPI attachment to proteins factor 4-like [Patella vulgata]|uniref:post-GPI attachment to proteins factor 4-like n=1 Tax=Patella vulgata TaxID=6465 RepID=UPI0021802650|nr:post-GPI attachment to proteins factor 4-like [Patella vulgata]